MQCGCGRGHEDGRGASGEAEEAAEEAAEDMEGACSADGNDDGEQTTLLCLQIKCSQRPAARAVLAPRPAKPIDRPVRFATGVASNCMQAGV